MSIHRAYRYCQWITSHHYENFPVASWLLPARIRPHVAAIYAFARSADDFADEGKYQGRSLEFLDLWRNKLWSSCTRGAVSAVPVAARSSADLSSRSCSKEGRGLFEHGNGYPDTAPSCAADPIFIALADTVQRFDLPVQLLDDLLTAFSMDVTKRRYSDWADLLNYCRYSANPVGRLVLALHGIGDAKQLEWSDSICTGLQLANHWQDLRIDVARDMIYIPQDLMRAHGVTEEELKARSVPGTRTRYRSTAAAPLPGAARLEGEQRFRSLMADLVMRSRECFSRGEPLIHSVGGRLHWELKLTLMGGRAILDQIEQVDYNVFEHRPSLSTGAKLGLLLRGLISS